MHIALIGCGEVGGAFARALRGKATLSLCDIEPGGRPGALAHELGQTLHPAPGAWLTECDLAIAAVPGRETTVAANSALPFLAPDAVYVDVSTGSPDDLRASAAKFAEAGLAFVDIAIMGAISLTSGATPVLIAGDAAAKAREPFDLMGAPVKLLEGGAPGDAVALKLLRSVIVKGIECVAIESFTAAEHLGLRDRLEDNLADIDASPIVELAGALITTHILHAERRLHEMEESAAQLKALGFDAAVTSALQKRYAATLAAHDSNPPEADAHEAIDKALAWLIETARDRKG